jgi:hypothetical protein
VLAKRNETSDAGTRVMKALPAGKARRVGRSQVVRNSRNSAPESPVPSERAEAERVESSDVTGGPPKRNPVKIRIHVSKWVQATRIALDHERPTPTS